MSKDKKEKLDYFLESIENDEEMEEAERETSFTVFLKEAVAMDLLAMIQSGNLTEGNVQALVKDMMKDDKKYMRKIEKLSKTDESYKKARELLHTNLEKSHQSDKAKHQKYRDANPDADHPQSWDR